MTARPIRPSVDASFGDHEKRIRALERVGTIPQQTVLKVPGPLRVDDFTPALYYKFAASHADVWCRITYRGDIGGATENFTHVLGWTEWVNDQAYYGDWWRTGGIALNTGGSFPGPIRLPYASYWETSIGSGEATGYRGSVTNPPTNAPGGDVYDVRAQFLNDIVVGPNTYSRWFVECWHNDVKQFDQVWRIPIDPGKAPFHGMQAVVIFNRYGETGPIYLDDVMVGTARGLADIMPVQNFDDGIGLFTLDPGDLNASVDSFLLYTYPPD